MSETKPLPQGLEMGTARPEAFTDGVMAVIITMMAFELRPPDGGSLDAVSAQLPGLLVYVLSFAFVAVYWNNHHHPLRRKSDQPRADVGESRFLFWLSLIPVLTEWLREEYRSALPATTYGCAALTAGFAFCILTRTLIPANGRDSAVARAVRSDIKGSASLAMYAAAVVVAFASPWLAYALWGAQIRRSCSNYGRRFGPVGN
jgi:uncharacterized membrane protein